MNEIYFDNSATTKISEGAKNKMIEVMDCCFGNPSSLHKVGLAAEKAVSEARNIILTSLGVNRGVKGELIFTSGGTESNNIAILGSVYSKQRKGNERILTTQGEHSSVENVLLQLEKSGFEVLRVPTKNGELDLDFIRKNAKGCILASFMHVNNETGALYDVKSAFDIVREQSPGAVCHSDCVQSYMKVKFNKRTLGADLISLSAHKINGAKGVGALYIDPNIIKTKRIVPIVYGGGQENNFRSGTENVYGICAFGQAAREHYARLNDEIAEMQELKNYIISGLEKIDGLQVNKPVKGAPHIINVTANGIRSETMLHFLSSLGIYVSSGSACSSNTTPKASPVLIAFGLSNDRADSSIRISLCPQNTKEDADALFMGIKEAVSRLAKK
ncbi:MAG: cysteine desulfurase [Ruminococcaceae bacterium]|nr:cysteine desulfurase [Oscillospiraceae bacterium]